MKKYASVLLLGPALLLAATGQSRALESKTNRSRPKIGLVLSGGGARGAAHVGVLKVLEELRIPVDYIAATSMGSAVGGLYAAGLPSSELDTFFRNFDWQTGFLDNPPRSEMAFRRKEDDKNFLVGSRIGFRDGKIRYPLGLVEGQNFITEMRTLADIHSTLDSFNQLPIPFRCMASDLVSGKPVIISSGDLALAIRASVAIPPLFSPVEYQGKMLIDGGYLKNIPVDTARAMGADILIVVNIGTPLAKRDDIRDIFDVVSQAGRLGGDQFDQQQIDSLNAKDILIEPNLDGMSFVDFKKIPEIINVGEKAARAMTEQLKKYSLSEKDYNAYLASRPPRNETYPVISLIELQNGSKMADRLILQMISQKTGMPLEPAQLQQDLARVYGLGYFDSVDYTVTKIGNRNILVIRAPRKSWGPGNLKFGFGITENFSETSKYHFSTRYTQTDMNSLGAEVRSNLNIGTDSSFDAEFHQPLDLKLQIFRYGAPLFVSPHVKYETQIQNLTLNGSLISRYRVKGPLVGLDLGNYISNIGQVVFGMERHWSEAKKEIGETSMGPTHVNWNGGNYYLRYSGDTLDRVVFPRSGGYGDAEWRQSTTRLGADFPYTTVDIKGTGYKSFGRNTINANAIYSSNLNEGSATPRIFALGGFMKLTAYAEDELLGAERMFASLRHYWNPQALGGSIYVGEAAEWGNTWRSQKDVNLSEGKWDGTLFIGMKTAFGPLYLAHSRGTDHHFATWLILGLGF